MNRTEWTTRTQHEPTEEEWQVITQVYGFHPAIPDVNGKDVLAGLYKVGGMGIIRDMLVTANTAETYYQDVREIEVEMDRKRQAIKQLEEDLVNLRGDLDAARIRGNRYVAQFRPEMK